MTQLNGLGPAGRAAGRRQARASPSTVSFRAAAACVCSLLWRGKQAAAFIQQWNCETGSGVRSGRIEVWALFWCQKRTELPLEEGEVEVGQTRLRFSSSSSSGRLLRLASELEEEEERLDLRERRSLRNGPVARSSKSGSSSLFFFRLRR